MNDHNMYEEMSDEGLVQEIRSHPDASDSTEALETLMNRYEHLVRNRAQDYYLPGGDQDDLVQEGMIGLYHAVTHYDENRGIPFRPYADVLIVRQVQTAVRIASRKKHVPLNQSISLENVSEDEMVSSLSYRKEPVRTPETMYIEKEDAQQLEQTLFDSLTSFERQVLLLSMDGMKYTQIAELLGRTPKSVDNARTRARRKIKAARVEKN